jgi:transposase
MQTVSTIGLDIAKSVFQIHGVDANGVVVILRQLKRRYVLAFFEKLAPCLVGIEACASSHYWSRELQALGHNVRLMPPAYVKPYVKRQKNDMADAEAICEAVTTANMRFVPRDLGVSNIAPQRVHAPAFTILATLRPVSRSPRNASARSASVRHGARVALRECEG